MDANRYQERARSTAIYPDAASVIYPAMLAGAEAGEAQNKVQKLIRKGVLNMDGGDPFYKLEQEQIEPIIDECGDVLWAIANLLSDLNVSMSFAMEKNLNKLQSRKERGVLEGEGDNR